MGKRLEIIDVNERKAAGQRELSIEEKRRRRQRIKARQQAIKRRRRKRLIRLAGTVIGVVLLGVGVSRLDIGKDITEEVAGSLDGASTDVWNGENGRIEALLYDVKYEDFFEKNKPSMLEDTEVYRCLKNLAKNYPELETIYERREEYPVNLLASLCNNPEMMEYVKGYLSYEAGETSGKVELTKEEKEQKYPLFLQWDKRWGYEAYGDFNIALSGCGPTTLAMAAVALTDDNTITPDRVAEYSMENGHYVEGTGTAWSLMTDGCENFGIRAKEIALDELVMKNQLDDGKVIICSMRKGDFTAAGHFVMIFGYNAEGFFINDPNCIYRSNQVWAYETLKNQIRILWAFERK